MDGTSAVWRWNDRIATAGTGWRDASLLSLLPQGAIVIKIGKENVAGTQCLPQESPLSIIGHNGPLSDRTPAAEPRRQEPLHLP